MSWRACRVERVGRRGVRVRIRMKVRVGCEREEEPGRGAYEEDGSADPDDGHHRYKQQDYRKRISGIYQDE